MAAKRVKAADYEKICRELGFLPEVNFIEIKNGYIGFTCGKPHEIKALYKAVTEAGYAPSKGLRETAKNL